MAAKNLQDGCAFGWAQDTAPRMEENQRLETNENDSRKEGFKCHFVFFPTWSKRGEGGRPPHGR